jgi:TonB family protein
MKTLKLVLASFAIAFSLSSFAQEAETAFAILTDVEFKEKSPKSAWEEEALMAKRNKTTKNARFRANANYTNVGGYLSQHLQFPNEARVLGVSGKVKVAFDILLDGAIANVEVLESPLDLFSKELIGVMQSMPQWSPAFRNGFPVKSRQEIHVNFRLP